MCSHGDPNSSQKLGWSSHDQLGPNPQPKMLTPGQSCHRLTLATCLAKATWISSCDFSNALEYLLRAATIKALKLLHKKF